MPLAAVSAADVVQPLAPSAPNLKAPNFEAYEHAVLRTLDKVTARTSTLEVPVNDILSVGTLSVTVRTCQKTPPTERPEAAAFIEIIDTPPEREPRPMFSGWMFASSPGLSALEHPIYDVWVVDCKMAPKASSAEGE
ncbi:MAG: DUF2155 domain-containing protein [Alphaproteobacteria bacterium]|nr:DUF2155 domain-containing protein [Alphaproteobacteria bacterium SS10]